MDYLKVQLEDSTAGTGFHITYYRRSTKLQVRQFHSGTVFSDIYVNTSMVIPLNTTSFVKLTIDASANTVKFEYDRSQNHEEATVALDQQVTRVNSIKTFLIEADYSVDNIELSTPAYSPYTYVEDFDSPELNGFAGPFVSYLYNTEDERVMKISPQGVTKYITDGNGQVSAEYDGYNNLKYNYIFGNGEKLAKADVSGTKEYYHSDYLGSVRRISIQSDGQDNGTVTWSRDYYPFGQSRDAESPNEDNLYTYEGKEKDLETDLWNNWKRHFSDEGRFTQVDPLWAKYSSLSPYVRVANNPLRFVDPNGNEIYDINTNQIISSEEALNRTISTMSSVMAGKVGDLTYYGADRTWGLWDAFYADHSSGFSPNHLLFGEMINTPKATLQVFTRPKDKNVTTISIPAGVKPKPGEVIFTFNNKSGDTIIQISGVPKDVNTIFQQMGYKLVKTEENYYKLVIDDEKNDESK